MFGDVISPDCTGMTDIFERLSFVKKSIKNEDGPLLVVGSSFGGLLALLLQSSDPEIVAGMVLCAPALHQPAAAGLKSEALPPTVIIHGIEDDVVPIDASRSFGAPLIEVEDDHRLSRSLELILREVSSMKLSLLTVLTERDSSS
jgi:pimeloyl-ACP methyl ester carboxylesterase